MWNTIKKPLRKMEMGEVNEMNPIMDEPSMVIFNQLLSKLKKLVRDDHSYRLLILITLFSHSESNANRRNEIIARLHR